MIGESELFERSKGENISGSKLLKRGARVMDLLEDMLVTHEKVVSQLLQIEPTIGTVFVGTHQVLNGL